MQLSSSSDVFEPDKMKSIAVEMKDNNGDETLTLNEYKDIFEDNHEGEETLAINLDDINTDNTKKGHDFGGWHREDLLYAVAKSRRYIYNVNSYDEDTLRSVVETLYEGLPMPERSPTFQSLDQFIIFDRGLRKLQREVRLNIAYGWVPREEREIIRDKPTPSSIKKFMIFLRDLFSSKPSRFKDWSRYQLIRALIGENIEMRWENSITTEMLRTLVGEVFHGRKKPLQSPLLSTIKLKKMDLACRKIQRNFRRFAQIRTMRRMVESSLRDRIFLPDGIDPEDEDKLMEDVERAETGEEQTHSFAEPYPSSSEDEEEQQKEIILQIEDELGETNPLWVGPSVEKAVRFADWNHPRCKDSNGNLINYDTFSARTGRFCMFDGWGEMCDFWGEGKYSDFMQFGVAITTYFKFLKWLYWMTFTLALVTLPCLLINTFGPKMEPDAKRLLTDISRTTVGNMVFALNNVTESEVFFPVCYGDGNIFDVNCQLDKDDLGWLYTWLDISGIFVLILGFLWLMKYEEVERKDLDQYRLFASAYAVKVTCLPEDVTEEELKNHFNRLLHNEKVLDVTIAYDDHDQIASYRQRNVVIKRRERKLNELRFLSKLYKETDEEWKINNYRKDIMDVKKSIAHLNNEIHNLDANIGVMMQLRKKKSPSIFHRVTEEEIESGRFNGRAVCAFITFADEKSRRFILDIYRSGHTSPFWLWFCMDKYKRLRTHYLWVTEAPEPSNILWENLQYNFTHRLMRRIFSASCTACMLICIVVACSVSRIYQYRTLEVGGKAHCPSQYFQMTQSEQFSYVQSSTEYLHCYCNIPSNHDHAWCESYLIDLKISTAVTVAVAFFLYVMNHLIDIIVPTLIDLERYHSTDKRDCNIFIRMLFMKVLNMGCVFLIGEDFDTASLLGQKPFSSDVLRADWYSTAGTILILSQVFGLIGYNLVHLSRFWYFEYRKKQARENPWLALSQKELNAFYLGPEMKLASRYGSALSSFFVCYIYSTGIPVLLPLASLNCFILYWVDKFLFVSYYRTPRDVTSDIPKLGITAIKLCIFAHIIISMVTLGNRDIFETPIVGRPDTVADGSDESLLALNVQEHTIPFLILCALCCLYLVCQYLFRRFLVQIVEAIIGPEKSEEVLRLQEKALGAIQSRKAIELTGHAIDYNQAIRNGRFKRLASYNILHNPIYQAAFYTDYEFGNTHKHIGSVWYHQPAGNEKLMEGTWGSGKEYEVIDVLEEKKAEEVHPTKPEEDMIRHLHPSVAEEHAKGKAFQTMQKMIFAEVHEDCRRKGRLNVIGSSESENSDDSGEDENYDMF